MAKHFFKTLIIFAVIIILGLIGVYLTSNSGKNGDSVNTLNNQIQVAK